MHYRHGVTLARLKNLFETAHTSEESRVWVDKLEADASEPDSQVSLSLLLGLLENAKQDQMAMPNIYAVRALDERLKKFEPEQLAATLGAVQTIIGSQWLSVAKGTLEVTMNQTADQITLELQRRITSEEGKNGD